MKTKQEEKPKPQIDKKALAAIKADKEKALKTNQIVKK